ncbi:MAG TPA: NAD(P)H-hydrate dehydratase [Lichenihabitans sp.]|nr:NAD(P)H-hydrate dehydratase [Lichenihabitans sp.]
MILSVAEMAKADRLTAETGVSLDRLMVNAGQAVARRCLTALRPGARVLVLCGPGNNGGDGYVVAVALKAADRDVRVASLVPSDQLRGDAARAAQRWGGAIEPVDEVDFSGLDLVVDALFGAGLSRPIEGGAAALIARLNASGVPVLAVDIPSGVDGDTGQVRGVAVQATSTVTFFRRKPGHVLLPGRLRCGATHVAEIGIGDDVLAEIAPKTWLNDPAWWRSAYPEPSVDGHKYSRGHALVVSGRMPTIGAARLAARGALRIGAGLVTVASPEDAVQAHAAQLTSIMLRPFDGAKGLAEILADRRKNAVVLGPGLGVGHETRDLVAEALKPAEGGAWRGAVLDADALTSFAGEAGALAELIAKTRGPVVATPHDGEFARLFKGDGPAFEDPSKLVRARAGAKRLGAVLLLKGDDTVVAAPDGRAALAVADAPWLATAGSGDVLAGFVGGLLAQGMEGFEATSAAVWLHGAAGRRFGPGLVSEDLPETLPAILRELLRSPRTTS